MKRPEQLLTAVPAGGGTKRKRSAVEALNRRPEGKVRLGWGAMGNEGDAFPD